MIDIKLDEPRSWVQALSGQRFVALGVPQDAPLSQAATQKMLRERAGAQPDLWGTLGPWEDSAAPGWRGTLRASLRGNDFSTTSESGDAVIHLIEHVKAGQAPSPVDADRVRERFIDLSDLQFSQVFAPSFTLEQEPSLRLTVFLRSDEGAVVAVQNGRFGEGGLDFVQPEPTPGFSCSARDRLTYRIPVSFLSQGEVKADPSSASLLVRGDSTRVVDGTSIKVLTFRRGNSTSREVVARALGAIRRDKYNLFKWDLASSQFVPVAAQAVRQDVKTLLLLHGTFSTTKGSFGPLIEGKDDSWLSLISSTKKNGFAQILAFDHDTVLDGVECNARELMSRLPGPFQQPVDVLTHSRGGLLGKQLAIYQPGVEVERAAMTACANGVGYFTAAQGLSRFLSVFYQLTKGSTAASVIAALAQHSIDAILSFDGLKVMIPNSAELARVAAVPVPPLRQQTVYLPIEGDFQKSQVEQDGFFKRYALRGLDELIKLILGPQHDWVVGTEAQGVFCPGSELPGFHPVPVAAYHTTYYSHPEVRNRAMQFLVLGS